MIKTNDDNGIKKVMVHREDGSVEEIDKAILIPVTPRLLGYTEDSEICVEALAVGSISGKEFLAIMYAIMVAAYQIVGGDSDVD